VLREVGDRNADAPGELDLGTEIASHSRDLVSVAGWCADGSANDAAVIDDAPPPERWGTGD
jgi:hypothetical protein